MPRSKPAKRTLGRVIQVALATAAADPSKSQRSTIHDPAPGPQEPDQPASPVASADRVKKPLKSSR